MKLKYTLEPIDMGDELFCVPVGEGAKETQGVLKLNSAGKTIVDLLENDTTEEQMVSTLASTYKNDRASLAAYVHSVVSALRDFGYLED